MYAKLIYYDIFRLANLRMSFSRSQQLLVELDAVFAASDDKTNIADGQQSFIADFVVSFPLSGRYTQTHTLLTHFHTFIETEGRSKRTARVV